MKEVEVKIRLPDICAVPNLVSQLKTLNARQTDLVRERNHILDINDGFLKNKGCMLRVREGLTGSPSSITFKGPADEPMIGGIKSREEIESSVQNPQAIIRILKGLGFEVRCSYSKIRQVYELCGAAVQIDDVAGLGYFVEIEDPDNRKINEIIRICRLNGFEKVTKSYAELMEEAKSLKPAE